jgi:hypothetical protein
MKYIDTRISTSSLVQTPLPTRVERIEIQNTAVQSDEINSKNVKMLKPNKL